MVVCDEEEEYAAKLVDYLNLKEGFPFDVRCFSEAAKVTAFMENHVVEILLCSEKMAEALEDISDVKKFLLQDSYDTKFENWDRIWKYQSCENMISEMMSVLSKSELEYGYIGRKKQLKTIGFYSPVKRTLQTTIAILLGETLGKRAKSLYINLESNSVLEENLNLEFSKDLSDIIYDMQGTLKGEEFYLASVMAKYKELYLLPGMSNHNDLITVPEDVWLQFLRTLEAETDYEYFILDLSDGVQGLYEILGQCDLIYETVTDGVISIQKVEKFHRQLEKSGYDDVIKKIRKCKIPYYPNLPEKIEEIRHSDLGKYVRTLVKDDEFYAG